MAPTAGDFLAGLRVIDWMPFRDDVEVGGDVEQALQQ